MLERGRTGRIGVGTATLRAAPVGGLGAWYTVRQQTPSCPPDYFIQNGRGEEVIRVTCVPPHTRDTLVFRDPSGIELYRTAAPAGSSVAMMEVRRPDGSVAATVHNAMLSPVWDRWRIEVPGGEGMVAAGNLLHHEYALRRGVDTIAVVSKTWVPRRDTYGVMVHDPANLPLVLAVAVVLDLLVHARPGDSAPADP
ncbi:MAG TPA: hypothetical protein VEQ60_13735 [Longimicrobium sp.]|nr:hypothetical protein [Longimicrobium sp.]